jgi:hypothetical protein
MFMESSWSEWVHMKMARHRGNAAVCVEGIVLRDAKISVIWITVFEEKIGIRNFFLNP